MILYIHVQPWAGLGQLCILLFLFFGYHDLPRKIPISPLDGCPYHSCVSFIHITPAWTGLNGRSTRIRTLNVGFGDQNDNHFTILLLVLVFLFIIIIKFLFNNVNIFFINFFNKPNIIIRNIKFNTIC